MHNNLVHGNLDKGCATNAVVVHMHWAGKFTRCRSQSHCAIVTDFGQSTGNLFTKFDGSSTSVGSLICLKVIDIYAEIDQPINNGLSFV